MDGPGSGEPELRRCVVVDVAAAAVRPLCDPGGTAVSLETEGAFEQLAAPLWVVGVGAHLFESLHRELGGNLGMPFGEAGVRRPHHPELQAKALRIRELQRTGRS